VGNDRTQTGIRNAVAVAINSRVPYSLFAHTLTASQVVVSVGDGKGIYCSISKGLLSTEATMCLQL